MPVRSLDKTLQLWLEGDIIQHKMKFTRGLETLDVDLDALEKWVNKQLVALGIPTQPVRDMIIAGLDWNALSNVVLDTL